MGTSSVGGSQQEGSGEVAGMVGSCLGFWVFVLIWCLFCYGFEMFL